jgi:hypothetical protein
MFDILPAARALFVTLTGIGLAWLWFHGDYVAAIALGLLPMLVGWGVDQLGQRQLPMHPQRGVALMEAWILTPAATAAVASAVVVIVAVSFALPADSTLPPARSRSSPRSGPGSPLSSLRPLSRGPGMARIRSSADHIRDVFQAHYGRKGSPAKAGVHLFDAESSGERWVFSTEVNGVEGWGSAARRKRAVGVARPPRLTSPGAPTDPLR